MSAINDALRRASGAAAGMAEPPPLPSEPLPLLRDGAIAASMGGETALPPLLQPPPAKKGFPWILLLTVLLFCAGGAAGFYLWQRHRTQTLAKMPGKMVEGTLRAAVQKQPVASEKHSDKTNAVDRPAVPVVTDTRTVASPAPVAAVAPVVPAPPLRNVQFPQLRLQGIYYRPSSPSVMINNRTLYLGDQVQGVTVAAIAASSVTLVLSGQTNVLTLR